MQQNYMQFVDRRYLKLQNEIQFSFSTTMEH